MTQLYQHRRPAYLPAITGREKLVVKPQPTLLRSLPLAQTCIHLGTKNQPERENCGTCTTWNCGLYGKVKLASCVSCADWQAKPHHEKPASTAGFSWEPIRFDHTNLFPGTSGIRFNSSIIQADYGYIFAFRNGWSGSNLFVCRMDKNFQPYGECKKLELGRKGAAVGREDPRLFRLNGKLHVSYTGYGGRVTNVLYARINEEFLEVEDVFFPQIPGRQKWEKNHTYFDYQGIAHAVYHTSPRHRILRIEGNKAAWAYDTPFNGEYSGGVIRGGCSPVMHNGNWYHFTHGVTRQANRRPLYNLGLIVFSATPPFQVLRYLPDPLDVADPSKCPPGQWADCIFPGGAVLRDDKWCITMGEMDRWCEIRFYDAAMIEAMLVDA